MGNTQLSLLPYPEPPETPYVHIDIQSLADAIDRQVHVVCTSTTRPPHLTGRIIYETDTTHMRISDGLVWLAFHVPDQGTLGQTTSGYDFVNALAERRNGWVRLSGHARRAAVDAGIGTSFVTIAQLGTGFRPEWQADAVVQTSGGATLQGRILTTGQVQVRSMTGTQLWKNGELLDLSGYGAFLADGFP